MAVIGTPFSSSATRVMLLGSGELGKEVVMELKRYGVETIAVDRYANAPAMQVADRSYLISMLDGAALRQVIEKEKPHLIVPEVEAIATEELLKLEGRGYSVVPTARAVWLTMNREGIRRLVAEDLKFPTSRYLFASTPEEYREAVAEIGFPCVIKPIMSSSGKGQSTVKSLDELDSGWECAQAGARGGAEKVIVEALVEFDYEITLLTVRHVGGVSYCEPIGHRQERGDYRESWQPHPMSPVALQRAQEIAGKVTEVLGGRGVFGVEFFVKGDEVIFSEVSPRPHDTGMVTLISQNLSEFALHARAILGLPIPTIRQYGAAASSVLLVEGESKELRFSNLEEALSEPDTELRLFGKPEVKGERRMGVALALDSTIEAARAKADRVISAVSVEF